MLAYSLSIKAISDRTKRYWSRVILQITRVTWH